jgi:hypothetical protein
LSKDRPISSRNWRSALPQPAIRGAVSSIQSWSGLAAVDMPHCWLSVPTKLIDEKTTCVAIKEIVLGTVGAVLGMVAIAIIASVLARFVMLLLSPDEITKSLRHIKRIERLERAREITPEQAHDEMVNEFSVYADREPKRSPRRKSVLVNLLEQLRG